MFEKQKLNGSTETAREIQKKVDSIDFFEMHGDVSSRISILKHVMLHTEAREVSESTLFNLSYLVEDIEKAMGEMATLCELTQDHFYRLGEER